MRPLCFAPHLTAAMYVAFFGTPGAQRGCKIISIEHTQNSTRSWATWSKLPVLNRSLDEMTSEHSTWTGGFCQPLLFCESARLMNKDTWVPVWGISTWRFKRRYSVQPSMNSAGGFGTKVPSLKKMVVPGESQIPTTGTGGLHPV